MRYSILTTTTRPVIRQSSLNPAFDPDPDGVIPRSDHAVRRVMRGEGNNDFMYGGLGTDILLGERGNDIIIGGPERGSP
ncbi:MAG: hypothetical protein R3F37_18395 [Candidatus Competibacteraceae bacterium]